MPQAQMVIEFDRASKDKIMRKLRRTNPVSNAPSLIHKPMRDMSGRFLGRVVKTAKANVRANRSDTGKLVNSIRKRVEGLGGTVTAGASYALFVHEGTQPHWPPPQALAGWGKRHGIPPFLVARKIAREGTEGYPFLTLAFESERAKLKLDLDVMATAVAANWGE